MLKHIYSKCPPVATEQYREVTTHTKTHLHPISAPVATVQLDELRVRLGDFERMSNLPHRKRCWRRCHWPQPQLTVTSHAQSRVTHESRVSTTHASRLLTLSQAGHMSYGPAGLFRPLWGNGKRIKAFKTTNPTDRSTFIIRCTRTFPPQLFISICDLQRKMRGASAALTSASAHPRAWRGEGERKRARAARAVNKSFVSPLRVIAYV